MGGISNGHSIISSTGLVMTQGNYFEFWKDSTVNLLKVTFQLAMNEKKGNSFGGTSERRSRFGYQSFLLELAQTVD